MSRPDPAASAALEGDVLPAWLIFLDFRSEPLRGCTAGHDITIETSPDPDLSGHTFDGLNSRMITIDDIRSEQGSTDTVTVTISGLPQLDNEALDMVNDPSEYRGRVARLWRIIRGPDGVQIGAIQPYYTGYLTGGYISSKPDEQIIKMQIEGYISAHSAPSMRTYLDQSAYDPGDLSAAAAVAISNSSGADPSIGKATGLSAVMQGLAARLVEIKRLTNAQ